MAIHCVPYATNMWKKYNSMVLRDRDRERAGPLRGQQKRGLDEPPHGMYGSMPPPSTHTT